MIVFMVGVGFTVNKLDSSITGAAVTSQCACFQDSDCEDNNPCTRAYCANFDDCDKAICSYVWLC